MVEPTKGLRCEELSPRYGRIVVGRDITFVARPGETLAILGPNGAGKTSVLGAIAGIVTSHGRVWLDGERVDHMSAHHRARHGIALVPEVRRNLFPDLTVEENFRAALLFVDRADRQDRLDSVLEIFPKLSQLRNQQAQSLSGGEQQMLALGVAIARKPSVLILDEPSQGLAPAILDGIADTLQRLCGEGYTVVVTEQNQAFAAEIATRYIVIRGGEVVVSGLGTDLADRDALAAAYLGGVQSAPEDT